MTTLTAEGRRVTVGARATVAAWVAMIGVDLLLHAGLLAPLYDWEGPFLLSPEEAFVRIPAGYLAFAVLAAGLAWLLPRLGVRGVRAGAMAGAGIGAAAWGALLLGIWSIASAEPQLLLAWWGGQTAQLAVGGAVIGAAGAGAPVSRLAWVAAGLLVGGLAAAVGLQSIGYAPAPIRIGG
ncbi:MAG TPA: hypothetical protein VF365_01255 [Candidatus Limnocylindria bacterium]